MEYILRLLHKARREAGSQPKVLAGRNDSLTAPPTSGGSTTASAPSGGSREQLQKSPQCTPVAEALPCRGLQKWALEEVHQLCSGPRN